MHDTLRTVTACPARLLASLGESVLLCAVALALIHAGTAWGQQVTDDSALEELRRRTPSGDNDSKIIDDWLQKEFAKITADGATVARGGFRRILSRVRDDPTTTQSFRDALADRLGKFAKSEMAKATSEPLAASDELIWALIDIDDVRTQPGLTAALGHPQQIVRYLGAKGLQALRDRIAADVAGNRVQSVVAALRQAGTQETSGVVVERIYGALSFTNATNDVLDALIAILDARLRRYRNGAVPADEAEATAIEYLSNASLPPAQRVQVVQHLAVLLRLDVERYAAGGKLLPRAGDVIERRICACEELITRMARPAAGKGGNVCREMGTGAGGVAAAMQFELINWIGSPQDRSVLNDAPWNVPIGAP